MPTLLRLLVLIGLALALGYAGMVAMVTFLQPQPRAISQPVTLPPAPR